jgi:2-oxoisovalerate dehydrogenase E1 component
MLHPQALLPMSVSTREPEARPSADFDLTEDLLVNFYATMRLLREFETRAGRHYRAGEMPGFIHLYVGEEAVATGVCAHLRRDDWITSTHRGHGHALAKGVPPEAVMDELWGRATGVCGGRGGSMHLYAPEVGLLGTNGFVGGGIPSAVGTALAARVRGTDQVGVAFFGDGAVNHAAFHESMNLAAAFNLPVLFVCEHNLYATATPLATVVREPDLTRRGIGYGIPSANVDGNDVVAVYTAAGEAVCRAREGGGPGFLVCHTYRTVGHHEGDPLVGTYRTREELAAWLERCPLKRLRARLEALNPGLTTTLDRIDVSTAERITRVIEHARAAPWPDPQTVFDHVISPVGEPA